MSGSRQWIVVYEDGTWMEARGCVLYAITLTELVESVTKGRKPILESSQGVPLLQVLKGLNTAAFTP
jgi:hypothetical protein